MEHPYRSTDAAGSPRARAVAGPNRLRTAWHFLLLFGLLGVAAWLTTVSISRWIPTLLAAVAIGDLVRTVHEAMLPHRITADARGLELVWAQKASWRPWMRRRSVAIAWDELLGVRLQSLSVNGLETTDIHLDRKTGPTLTIPHGTFAPGAAAIQQAILDERDDRIEAPLREAADVAGFCSDAFAEPRTLRLRIRYWARAIGTLFGMLLSGGSLAVATSIGGSSIVVHLALTLPGLLAGVFLLYAVWTVVGPRVLRLSAEGLAHGRNEARLELVPWSRIRFARPTVLNGTVIGVRVAIRGGRDLALAGDYGLPLMELAAMIAPPAKLVLLAREQAKARASAAP
jgi:hypothetical protein